MPPLPSKFRLSPEFWVALAALGLPGLLWGGSMTSRMENVEATQRTSRAEIREDLKEVNRKLDVLLTEQSKK